MSKKIKKEKKENGKIATMINMSLINILFIVSLFVLMSQNAGREIWSMITSAFDSGGGAGIILSLLAIFIPGVVVLYAVCIGVCAIMGAVSLPFFIITGNIDSLLSSIFKSDTIVIGIGLWLLCVAIIWAEIYAFMFKFGKFQEDSSYVSGTYYEITVEDGKGIVREKEEYSGGGEWIINCELYCLRVILLLVCGTLFYFLNMIEDFEPTRKEITKKKMFNGLLIASAVLLIWTVFMFVLPHVAFRFFHFSVAIFICIAIAICIISAAIRYFKKARRVLLILAMVLFVVGTIVACAAGRASINVYSAADLEAAANIPFAGSRNYTLKNDIDYKGKTSSFFSSVEAFENVFEGNHHSISNINFVIKNEDEYAKESYVGFFKQNRGTIQNVRFDNIKINMTVISGKNYVGIVAGRNSGTISNCLVADCSIKCQKSENISSSDYFMYLGGIVGICKYGNLKNVAFINNADDTAIYGKGYNGGIAGEIDDVVKMNDIFVLQKNQRQDDTGGLAGNVYREYYDSHCYITNAINCFAVQRYGDFDYKALEETNVFDLNEPPKKDLPPELSHWTYSSEFECFIPCTGFTRK